MPVGLFWFVAGLAALVTAVLDFQEGSLVLGTLAMVLGALQWLIAGWHCGRGTR